MSHEKYITILKHGYVVICKTKVLAVVLPSTQFLDVVFTRNFTAEWRQNNFFLINLVAEVLKVKACGQVVVKVFLRPSKHNTRISVKQMDKSHRKKKDIMFSSVSQLVTSVQVT